MFLHLFKLSEISLKSQFLRRLQQVDAAIIDWQLEYCFNIEISGEDALSEEQLGKLRWLISETYDPEHTGSETFININDGNSQIIEVGPRLAFSTAWSSNCLSMFQACGITRVSRIERSRRYKLIYASGTALPLNEVRFNEISALLYDRMTECVYQTQLNSFYNGLEPEKVRIIPILSEGKGALEALNREKGLGFDDWDLDFYTSMFQDTLKRDPTDVECFDLGQSNSEHSRHWFFGGKMVIDGEEKKETLFGMVKSTLPKESNSVIAFHDNSSAIQGFPVQRLTPIATNRPAAMALNETVLHPILTAETHNFPSGVAPFPGAETGTGGRLRDVQATGRGAHTLAGVSSYCVGNLYIPDHPLPWEQEDPKPQYSNTLASPLNILIEASNGASDYGNKYGESVVCGFTRSFGQRLPSGERYEWIKPIMFTAGVGLLDSRHSTKGDPEVGMIVCKIGGPAYRIGMGGGAASSRAQGDADSALDFNAVQRGDAEMENRMNRVIRGCIELGEKNPIVSIHDQGAGGNGNVLKEIVDPKGAKYELRAIPVGDSTLSVLEIWGAEYQENNAFLIRPADLDFVLSLSRRENCPVTPIGVITGDGNVTVVDRNSDGTESYPFNMPLSLVLGKMPQKCFTFTSPDYAINRKPLALPAGLTVLEALERVLKLVDVGSKRFLTNKVDRSVTGLIAQQQCVGPLHTPLSNVGVVASSHFNTVGIAVAVGEQPIKGLLNPKSQARLTVGEALTNLMWAKITSLSDVKASGNWMWAAKLEGEGAKMWDACAALCDALKVLGPAIDGGKDSLSMAAKIGNETVKSPGEVTLTCYAACTDITKTVTPDLKYPGKSQLLYIDMGSGKSRLGGTAFSTVYGQLGDEAPDVDDLLLLKRCFNAVQDLIERRLIAAGHDRSDGGLITCAVEMAIAGNKGINLKINRENPIPFCFSEELGLLIEVLDVNTAAVMEHFAAQSVPCVRIGDVRADHQVVVTYQDNDEVVFDVSVAHLRELWESTSFALEKLQCNTVCVEQEERGLRNRVGPQYTVSFKCVPIDLSLRSNHRVAVIRQEGSNGDREMLSAFYAAGFDAWDVNMRDLLDGHITLDSFRGIIFSGGFSYADVNDSAKGWAGVIKFNERLLAQFTNFRFERKDTFTLGVCNGCQLMALLGWIPFEKRRVEDDWKQPRFIHNVSGRFESRWTSVQIQPSPAVLLQGMEGSTLGIWVAHGEGKAYFPDNADQDYVLSNNLAPIRYVDDLNQVTGEYPHNPNGSPHGIAAMCSVDGRHLAMMPHPERCFQAWQWPYFPSEFREKYDNVGPWIKMFQNAKDFCDATN